MTTRGIIFQPRHSVDGPAIKREWSCGGQRCRLLMTDSTMRRVRMTTRRWMIAVAIVGLVSGGTIELARRRQRFLRAYREQALAEFECSVKAQILIGTMGGKGLELTSMSELASMCGLDSEERRLLEDDEDLRAMMRDAGWGNLKALPLRIDRNETMNEFGGDRLASGLGTLLRGEAYHRRMRRKYQRAAARFWLPVPSESVP
jgi:hypothetical protein